MSCNRLLKICEHPAKAGYLHGLLTSSLNVDIVSVAVEPNVLNTS